MPLRDMALHFRVEVDTLRPLVEAWVRKGKARKLPGSTAACKGCCTCDPATIELYEWQE